MNYLDISIRHKTILKAFINIPAEPSVVICWRQSVHEREITISRAYSSNYLVTFACAHYTS